MENFSYMGSSRAQVWRNIIEERGERKRSFSSRVREKSMVKHGDTWLLERENNDFLGLDVLGTWMACFEDPRSEGKIHIRGLFERVHQS